MARVDTTQATVLERVVARLREQLELTERQVRETIDPMSPPIHPMGGDYFLTVSPGAGTFEEGEQDIPNVTEDFGVSVTIFTRIAVDDPSQDSKLLRDAKRGLFPLKRLVLKALVGYDLAEADGDTMLRQIMYAKTCSAVNTGKQEKTGVTLGHIVLEFGVPFDWDLT